MMGYTGQGDFAAAPRVIQGNDKYRFKDPYGTNVE